MIAERERERELYSITTSHSGKTQRSSELALKDWQFLTTVEDQLRRWAEHFSGTLNRDDPRNPPRLETNIPELGIT